MKGICLQFYTYELQKHQGILLYEWLLELAKKNGIPGGSAFRALAGFGRDGILHEEHFFELASNVPVEVKFILSEKEALSFLEIVKKEGIPLFYTQCNIEYHNIPHNL
jgi:PII-like signaling protein